MSAQSFFLALSVYCNFPACMSATLVDEGFTKQTRQRHFARMCVQADSNGALPEPRPSNTGRGGPPSTSSDTGVALDLDTDSPYISMRSSRQNSMQDSGPASKDVELEASVLDTLTDSVLTGVTLSSSTCVLPHHASLSWLIVYIYLEQEQDGVEYENCAGE